MEIEDFILAVDKGAPDAVNVLRVIPLKNALAYDMANLLRVAIPGSRRYLGGLAGGGVAGGAIGIGGTTPATPTTGISGATGFANNGHTLRFYSDKLGKDKSGMSVDASVLIDMFINWDTRTNSLIISAPEQTMALILAVIKDLDVPPLYAAQVNVIKLKNADANAIGNIISQMFLGTVLPGATGAAGGGGAGGGAAGATAGGGKHSAGPVRSRRHRQ